MYDNETVKAKAKPSKLHINQVPNNYARELVANYDEQDNIIRNAQYIKQEAKRELVEYLLNEKLTDYLSVNMAAIRRDS